MVAMIYRMMSQDLAKFGVVFFIFLMGFSQVKILLSSAMPEQQYKMLFKNENENF
jgi:hypothetical protein